jgi:hypothetical protein
VSIKHMIDTATTSTEIEIPSDRQHVRGRLLQFLQRRTAATRAQRRWAGSGALGLALTVLLHVLLLSTFIWGGEHQSTRRDKNSEGAGASERASTADPGPTMIMINLTAVATEAPVTDPLEEIASAGVAPKELMIQIASNNPLPAVPFTRDEASPDDNAKTAEAVGNDAQRAMLLGMYMGQIKARIERAWSRPRASIGAMQFNCQVQLVQSARGDVTEVSLRSCNGDTRWQLSLVAAIQSASPLPAPPDPSLFAGQLMLNFDASAYHAGGNEQGFEPVLVQLANAH